MLQTIKTTTSKTNIRINYKFYFFLNIFFNLSFIV